MYSYKAFGLIQCVSRVGVGGVNPIILCARALLISLALVAFCQATDDARRLYDDLLKKSNYNRVVRPGPGQEFYDQLAKDPTANYTLELRLKLKLAQIIDVAEKSEIITMNTWLTQQWYDYKLQWNPKHYGNVTELNIPSESIWVPDLTLYNNADGDYVVTLMTKARVRYDGRVHWEPPAVFKSYCNINVFYFPFDEQHCHMKFSTWTYDGEMIGLTHLDWKDTQAYNATIYPGIDLMQLYPNNEWDIMNVTARKKQKYYPCCKERYYDLYFYITIRRKTLFYSYNVLIPVVSINMLTILAFYLPADCGEKISLCISILLSLSLFQLMLMDTMPPTSLTMPLLGKYILFTTVVVSLSVFSSVQVLNVHFRSAATHKMPYCTRKLFLCILPRLLFMNKPKIKERRHGQEGDNMDWTTHQSDLANYVNPYKKKFKPIYREQSEENVAGCSNTIQGSTFIGFNPASSIDMNSFCELCATVTMKKFPPNVIKAMDGVMFVAKHLNDDDETNRVKCEWKYVGLVVDRLLLWLFTTVCVVGALSILINAPVLYDSKVPFCEVHPEMCRKVED